MRTNFLSLIAVGAFALCPTLATAADKGPAVGRYIVVLKDGQDSDAVARGLGRQNGFAATHVYSHALKGFSAALTAGQAAQLAADQRVAYVADDAVVSTTHVGKIEVEVFGPSDGQTIPTGESRIGASAYPTGSTANVDVAVIDTGIDLDHPDLNVFQHVSFVGGTQNNAGGDDDHGHGSHVAGTIAAKDDHNGVVGVAPGARLWAVKVLSSSGSGSTSDIIKGIDYVAANAASIEVANMSLGGRTVGKFDPMRDAIKAASALGVVFVVAAGNDKVDCKNFAPANYPEVITVSAIADSDGLPGHLGARTDYGYDDTFASFSNYGPAVDLAAPGVWITSTHKNGGYARMSGTSMACPHVAGAAALYLITNAKPANQQGVDLVKQALINGSWPQTDAAAFTGDRDTYRERLLNATDLAANSPVTTP
jgi:subtilisin